MESSIFNVVFMRMSSPFVEKTLLGFERIVFAFPFFFVRESRPLLNVDTATFSVGVLAVGVRTCVCAWHCWFHWNLQLLSQRSDSWRQILQLRREEYHEFPLLTCSLYFGFFVLLRAHLDHTSGQTVSGLHITWVLTSTFSIHP